MHNGFTDYGVRCGCTPDRMATHGVADGLRSLGSSVDRKEFQSLLVSLLKENEIEFVHVKESDYDTRFLRCVELVKQLMGEQG